MKLALCQINTTVADFKGNTAKVLKGMAWAKKGGASLALFPELATFGYPPRDLLDKPYLIAENIAAAERIAAETTKDFGAVFGFVARNKAKVGRGLWNAAAFAFGGRIRHIQPKALLPTYDVFDEARHFDPGCAHSVVSFLGVPFGLMICEDLWSEFDFGGRRYYETDPPRLLKKKGAKVLINISASPFHAGIQATRRELVSRTAGQNGMPVIYCNLVGGNDELVFDGGSLAADSRGEICFEGGRFREGNYLVDLGALDQGGGGDTGDMPAVEEVYEALLLGLKDYVRKCGFKKALVGLSGGIDSAVVACLAQKALGPKNVLGVSLPSPYSSRASLDDAKQLAERLGIKYRVIPIGTIYEEYLKALKMGTRSGVSLAAENIQARVRGNILMAISNQTGALVLSTGNKSEMSTGYCTLYGDLAGGLAVLSDVPKTFVYALARWINRKETFIDETILKKAPSAELKPGQKDEDTLPPYPVLDGILKAYVEEQSSLEEIVAQGFPAKVVAEVLKRVDNNEYKRRQSPPGIKVTSKAFGMGRRLPIACGPMEKSKIKDQKSK